MAVSLLDLNLWAYIASHIPATERYGVFDFLIDTDLFENKPALLRQFLEMSFHYENKKLLSLRPDTWPSIPYHLLTEKSLLMEMGFSEAPVVRALILYDGDAQRAAMFLAYVEE
jgi:hypothetical protein